MNKPNFIVIFADNLGYGDLGCYGSTVHRTPNVDRLAEEGTRLTSFYSTSGVCTPSRASLMTGCYPRRVNMHVSGDGGLVLRPLDRKGLNPSEVTIAGLLQENGYATACIGKWHLGDQAPFLPTQHGFDYYYGIPYSDDMTPNEKRAHWPPLPLMRNEDVVKAPVDRDYLTKRYTEEAVLFIRKNRDRPFFVYLPHAMPGSTAHPFASPDFKERSSNGAYGDSIEEMDWSTGEIVRALKELGLEENTLIIWTSDNGAVRRNPPQGSNAPLKGWGYDTSEGAMRMPCIAWWPGKIQGGTVCDEVATTMDVLPTLAALAETGSPADRTIDGHDLNGLLFSESDEQSGYVDEGFYYYFGPQLQAVRSGPWKLYLALDEIMGSRDGKTARDREELYDVCADLGESREVSAENPDVVKRLLGLAELARVDLGDLEGEGANQRPAGWVEDPVAQVIKRKE